MLLHKANIFFLEDLWHETKKLGWGGKPWGQEWHLGPKKQFMWLLVSVFLLIVVKLSDVKQFPAVYETWMFVAVFTKTYHRPLPWASWHRVRRIIFSCYKIRFNNFVLLSALPSHFPAKTAHLHTYVRRIPPAHQYILLSNRHNYIKWTVQVIKLPAICYSCLCRYVVWVCVVAAVSCYGLEC